MKVLRIRHHRNHFGMKTFEQIVLAWYSCLRLIDPKEYSSDVNGCFLDEISRVCRQDQQK